MEEAFKEKERENEKKMMKRKEDGGGNKGWCLKANGGS